MWRFPKKIEKLNFFKIRIGKMYANKNVAKLNIIFVY